MTTLTFDNSGHFSHHIVIRRGSAFIGCFQHKDGYIFSPSEITYTTDEMEQITAELKRLNSDLIKNHCFVS